MALDNNLTTGCARTDFYDLVFDFSSVDSIQRDEVCILDRFIRDEIVVAHLKDVPQKQIISFSIPL